MSDDLRHGILSRIDDCWREAFAPSPLVPGQSPVPVSGRVFDADDIRHLVDASLDFWLTT